MTLHTLYRHIIHQLSDILGMDEAKATAYLLLEYFTSHDKIFICLNPNIEIANSTVEKINKAVQELQNHKPIQYVLGQTFFCDLPFFVDESVLIPRPETEELVQWIIENSSPSSTIIDICTGSGCIAIALANYLKVRQVYAIDVSNEALKVAQKNAENNDTNIHFVQKDVLSSVFCDSIGFQFDIIVSNPPYVRKTEKQYMHERVLKHEPSLALFVEDNNPLIFYKKILQFGRSHLVENGQLYFEINEAFGEEIVRLFLEYGYKDVVLRKDIHDKNRMICGKINK